MAPTMHCGLLKEPHTRIREIDVASKLSTYISSLEKKLRDHLSIKNSENAMQTKFLVRRNCEGALENGECEKVSNITDEVNYIKNLQH